jgi:hypothetical protein
MYIIGLDLGQSQDFTAISIIEKLPDAIYHVRRLERTRGTSYPDIVTRVKEILDKLPGATLVLDSTGVGQPVADMFRKAGLAPIAISIHGGDKASHDGPNWRVPKRDLVGVLQVLLQNKRLKIAPGPLSDILATEMLNFKVKIDPATAHDSYSAWREADHDDLVLSVALGCWYGEQRREVPICFPSGTVSPGRWGDGGGRSGFGSNRRR